MKYSSTASNMYRNYCIMGDEVEKARKMGR